VKIARLSSCKNFVSKREKFIFDAFVHMHSADYAVARCLFCSSVCLSHAGIVSKRLTSERL